MFWRVATVVAEADRRYGASEQEVYGTAVQFYELMTQRRFEPNSPTLMNAGRPLGQLSPASSSRWLTRSATGTMASTTR